MLRAQELCIGVWDLGGPRVQSLRLPVADTRHVRHPALESLYNLYRVQVGSFELVWLSFRFYFCPIQFVPLWA